MRFCWSYPLFVDGIGDLVLDDVFDDLLALFFNRRISCSLRDKLDFVAVQLKSKSLICQVGIRFQVIICKLDLRSIAALNNGCLEEAILHFFAFAVVGVDRHRLAHRIVRCGKLIHCVDKIFPILPLHRLPRIVGILRPAIERYFNLHILQAGLEGRGVPLLCHRNRFLLADAVGDDAIVVDKVVLLVAHPTFVLHWRLRSLNSPSLGVYLAKDLLIAEFPLFINDLLHDVDIAVAVLVILGE